MYKISWNTDSSKQIAEDSHQFRMRFGQQRPEKVNVFRRVRVGA